MKKLWARIGRTYEVSDEVYEKICEEVRNNNPGALQNCWQHPLLTTVGRIISL